MVSDRLLSDRLLSDRLLSEKKLQTMAPKRAEPEVEPFDVYGWLDKFAELQFVENYDKWARGEDAPNFYWFPNYRDRGFAIEIDADKDKAVALLKELNDTTGETFPKLVAMHTDIAETMEFMKLDPYAKLWQLMKYAMEEAIESFSLAWEWEEGSVDAAQAGSGADQHGYFCLKQPRKKGKKGKKRR